MLFQPDRVMEFCNNNDLQLIVRAHECVMDGFERFAQGHLITLFSATNYCGMVLSYFDLQCNFWDPVNDLAFMFGSCHFQQVRQIMQGQSWFWVEILWWFRNSFILSLQQFHHLKHHQNAILRIHGCRYFINVHYALDFYLLMCL